MKCRRLPSHRSRAAALPCRRISYKIPKAEFEATKFCLTDSWKFHLSLKFVDSLFSSKSINIANIFASFTLQFQDRKA